MRKKSQELLDNLKNITAKTDRFARKPTPSSTNRWWPGTSFGSLPQSYDKAKRHKDEDGDEFIYVDRVYGGLFGHSSLEQKDGRTYTGKLYTKRRLVKSELDGNNFYSPCTVTADGRWFDNSGWPIEPPKKLDIEPEAKPDEDDIEEQKRIAREREQRIIAGLK